MSTLSVSQLADLVVKAKLYMGLTQDSEVLQADGIAVFCSATDATAATVQVTDTTVVLIITGGANSGTVTLTLADAANDTLAELATVIDGTAGWTANLLGKSGVDSDFLIRLVATGALLQANELTLIYEDQALLELLITNLWARIETMIGRGILSTVYTGDLFRVNDDRTLYLDQPDVTQVQFVGDDLGDGLTVKYTGSDTNARVEVTDEAVVTVSRAGATPTTTTSTFANNVTTTAMAVTINALSGWTATVNNARPSAFLERRGVQDAKDSDITLEFWEEHGGEYRTEYDEGVIQFETRPIRHRIRVDYTAGFTTMPADVEQTIIEVIKASWDAGSKDFMLKEEKIGDYMYKLAGEGLNSTPGMALIDALTRGYERILP